MTRHVSGRRARLAALAAAITAITASAPDARAHDGPPSTRERPTWVWAGAQLVPSSELAIGREGARAGLGWQVTPLLYSWGLHRRTSPWRFFVVDPIARQSGSLELYVAPELFVTPDVSFAARPGVRAYFGLLSRGEYLSASLGTSYQAGPGRASGAFDIGLHTYAGVIGLVATVAPFSDLAPFTLTLRFRYY